ncbi:MAG TPA: GrpB family protein [Thermomicrobiales bacterium]|nr:GrpB family protein [Thermomicrobiales bacterium]
MNNVDGGDRPIGTYEYLDYSDPAAIFRPYDPRFPEVARRVAALIEGRMPGARVEHVGSTAVPNCAGKGNIDLLLRYTAGELATAREALDSLGFQRQQGANPFPESRPLRLGAIDYDGETFRLHVHVVGWDDPEAAELLRFRDRLRADPALVEAYVASKRAALTAGPTDNIAYNRAKQPFIRGVIAEERP